MSKFIYHILFINLFISGFFCSWNLAYDCFLKNGEENDTKISFQHFNFFTNNRYTNIFETTINKMASVEVKTENGDFEHAKKLFVKPDDMNIISFYEDGEIQEFFLGNKITRKFSYFEISIMVKDLDKKISTTDDVTKEMLIDSSNYVADFLPTFSFELNGVNHVATCIITDPIVSASSINVDKEISKPTSESIQQTDLTHKDDQNKFVL